MAAGAVVFQRGDHLHEAVVNGRPKDLLLVLEVVVDRRPIYSGFVGDCRHRCAVDSLALQDRAGRVKDGVTLGSVLRTILVLGGTSLHRKCWRTLLSPCHTNSFAPCRFTTPNDYFAIVLGDSSHQCTTARAARTALGREWINVFVDNGDPPFGTVTAVESAPVEPLAYLMVAATSLAIAASWGPHVDQSWLPPVGKSKCAFLPMFDRYC